MIGDNIVNWEHVRKQIFAYRALDKFVPGESGMRYYQVPAEMWQAWFDEQNRKKLELWKEKNK